MRFRDCIAAALIALWAASAASAQQTADESSQIRHGERKIRIGLGLMAAGALVIPATYIVSDRLGGGPAAVGGGLMMAGGVVMALGMRDQQKAVRPATTAAITVTHRRAAVQFRRAW